MGLVKNILAFLVGIIFGVGVVLAAVLLFTESYRIFRCYVEEVLFETFSEKSPVNQ